MKKILLSLGAMSASAFAAQAQSVVYSTDFNSESYFTDNGAIAIGGATPSVSIGEWFGFR
ncbi:hypothetical protein QEH52_07555 [Coraliomargarita sp. SDUM461003]|uniref:Porin n=1 Tax=Thalassobacterium maritimum TaxID=3041265 RepID=A0ABU1AT72_9BACT|nr:hypothetical protein [Coraliomargarita sp. SDUM461003]MDQ8207358.1 hypothetical protein [Coraliomargarita sp. SDUM461003]